MLTISNSFMKTCYCKRGATLWLLFSSVSWVVMAYYGLIIQGSSLQKHRLVWRGRWRTVLENRKPESGELRCISKAEFCSLSLKQVVKASFYFDLQESCHPPSTYTRPSSVYQIAPGIFSCGYCYHDWVYFNFNTTFKCILFLPCLECSLGRGENCVRGKAGCLPKGFVVRWGFSW